MRLKTIFFLVFLFLFPAVLCFAAADEKQETQATQGEQATQGTIQEAQGAPVAVVSEPVFEFQEALDGDEVLHDFIIKNTGTAELTIDRVKTG